MLRNAPRKRKHKPNPTSKPTDEDLKHEAFVPKRFGEALTADRVANGKDEAADKHVDKCALVVLDKYAGTIAAYPAIHNDAETTQASFLQFVAPNDDV